MKTVFKTEVSICHCDTDLVDRGLIVRGSVSQSGSPFSVTEITIDEVLFDDGSNEPFLGELTEEKEEEAERAILQAWGTHLTQVQEQAEARLEDEWHDRRRRHNTQLLEQS